MMSNSGTKTMPMPMPATSSGAVKWKCPTPVPDSSSTANSATTPTALMTRPACRTVRPSFAIVIPPIAEPANPPTAYGAEVRLASIGE